MSDTNTKTPTPDELKELRKQIGEAISNLPSLPDQYRDAVEYLDDNFAYFLTHVLNIGAPRANMGLPTACVAVSKDSKDIDADFTFEFNPVFGGTLSIEHMGFVLGHETMHILLNHLKLSKRFKDKQRFNIAADCVINDYLFDMGLDMPDWVCRGENIVGYNCANSTVTDVYGDVKAQQQDDGDGDGDGGQGDQPGDGSGYGQYGSGSQPVDDHDWIHKADEAAQKAAEKAGEGNQGMPQDLQDKADEDNTGKSSPGYSPVGIAGAGAFSELKGVGLEWAKLLEKINPFMFKHGPRPRPNWAKRPRKLAGMPEVLLPTQQRGINDEGGEIPAIVMALDTSGSIPEQDRNRFVNLAKSIPQNKVKLFACTFTTQYMPLDLENPQWQSGGTSFSAVEDFIQNEVKDQIKGKYPKAVVVITDGAAYFDRSQPAKEHHDAWYWLFTDYSYSYGDLPGVTEKLTKYVKGAK